MSLRNSLNIASTAALLFSIHSGIAIADAPVKLNLEANVEPRCEISKATSTSVNLSSDVLGAASFILYCNTEMTINIASANGGLLHETRSISNADAVEVYLRPYDFDFTLLATGFSVSANSADIKTGISYSVPGVIFEDTAELNIQLEKPIDDGFAGEYVDELRITVTPSLSASPS